MNLLADHRRNGLRFEPLELIEEGARIAVRLAYSDPWSGTGETFKVFTFADSSDDVVLLEDCADREHALALLAA